MPLRILSFAILLGLCAATGCSKRRETVPWERFIEELARPDSIADIALDGTVIFTSYDRTGGNNDYGNGIVEAKDGWLTLVDLSGPGVMTRLWFTGVKQNSTFRFLFDGESASRLERTCAELFQGTAPFDNSLTRMDQNCFASYFPIPYQRRLRIQVSDDGYSAGDGKLYYQINATPLNEKNVESAAFPVPAEVSRAAATVATTWGRFEESGEVTRTARAELQPGTRESMVQVQGSGVIDDIRFTIEGWAEMPYLERCRVLSDIWVEAYWDGTEEASVRAPLGLFCGVMWEPLSWSSFYLGAEGDTLWNRFPMPFRTGARFDLINHGSGTVTVQLAAHQADTEPHDSMGYFHCGWKRSTPTASGRPHTVLDTRGAGRVAGCMLGAASFDNNFLVLESDETILKDGQEAPFWQGTGLEDYFNGGWYYRTTFAEPLYGLTLKRPYRTVQYRFHLTDPITFSQRVQMSFERGHANQSRAVLDSVIFYYLSDVRPGFGDGAGKSSLGPPDPLQARSLMTRLWDYERFGDLDNARTLVKHALATYGYDGEERAMLALRELDYRALLSGYPSVREEIAELCELESAAGEAARQLSSMYEGQTTLLSIYSSRPTELWVDDRVVARTEAAERSTTVAVPSLRGMHTLGTRSVIGEWPHWVQMAYRSNTESGGIDHTWRQSVDPPEDWPKPDYDDSRWKAVTGFAKGPPEMEAMPFAAVDPFVNLQSQAEAVRPSAGGIDGARVLILRREIEF